MYYLSLKCIYSVWSLTGDLSGRISETVEDIGLLGLYISIGQQSELNTCAISWSSKTVNHSHCMPYITTWLSSYFWQLHVTNNHISVCISFFLFPAHTIQLPFSPDGGGGVCGNPHRNHRRGRTVAATEYLLDGLMLTVAEKWWLGALHCSFSFFHRVLYPGISQEYCRCISTD